MPALLHCYINDADILIGFVSFGIDFDIWDSLNNFHSFSHPSKHTVLVVKPWLLESTEGEKEKRVKIKSSIDRYQKKKKKQNNE